MTNQGNRLFAFEGKLQSSSRKAVGRPRSFEQLEDRQMLHGAGLETSYPSLLVTAPREPAAYMAPAMIPLANSQATTGTASSLGTLGTLSGSTALTTTYPIATTGTTDPRTLDIQMGLPALDSNPSAPATLYLDFHGNFERDWWQYDDNHKAVHYSNITTPVFDTDGNTAAFSTTEQSLIKEIWSRVAEDYAPFNINVSTDYYGTFNNGQAVKAVIGGNNTDWLKQNASGISSIGSFSDDAPNEVFVFNLMTWATAGVKNGDGVIISGPAAIATTVSHEAGHSFGLRHHALYNADGTTITNYDPGTSTWTPIMGDNLASDRTTWYAGPTDQGAKTWQDDIAVLSGSADGFGLKADDHTSSIATADSLTTGIRVGTLTGKGIINNINDIDTFKFTTGGGSLQITVNSATYGPNLIPLEALYSSTGALVARVSYFSPTQSIISTTLTAGTYYVMVMSYGDYGDLGQYSVTVSFNTVLVSGSTLAISTTTTTATTTQPVYSTSLSTASYGSAGSGYADAPVETKVANQFVESQSPSKPAKPTSRTAEQLHDRVFQELGELEDGLEGLLPRFGLGVRD